MDNGERGVIISPGPVNIGGNFKDGIGATQSFPGEDFIKPLLFFFDKIVWPVTSGGDLPHSLPEHILYLQDERILWAPTFKGGKILPAKDEAACLFDEYERREPGQWSVTEFWPSPDAELTGPGRSLIVKLYRAIPVPARDMPFDDILRFRVRYRDERFELRDRIEDIYQTILSAGDGPLMIQTQVARLEQSIAHQFSALQEAKMRFALASLEARFKWEFDLRPALIAAGAVALASGDFVLAGVGAAIATNLLPKIEISTGPGVAREGAFRSGRPFQYVFHMHHDL